MLITDDREVTSMIDIEKEGNLFTDMYCLREKLYFENANNLIREVKEDVAYAIQEDSVPNKLRYLLFKLTNMCNSNCIYCSHAIGRQPQEEKYTVSHDIVIRTIKEAAEMGVQAISVSGGEPLLREDIVDIIRTIVDYKMIPVLLTNGLLLDKYWDILGEAGLRYIVISLDSVNKNIYETQRGANFERALSGIDAAMKLREKYGDAEIHVSAVLTENNHEDFMQLVDFMRERKIKVQVIPYHKRENDIKDYSIKEQNRISELTHKLIEIKKESQTIANSIGFLRHLPDFFCKGKTIPEDFVCKVGYTNLCIDAYMDVKPCWSYLFEPIGNLNKNSLYEMWNSEKLQIYRKRMLEKKCEGCWYLCTSEICMMLDNE